MSRTIVRRPSVGFVFLVSAHLLLISMLAWGYTTPELDRVWLIQQRMHRDNFDGLLTLDAQAIRTALHDYPGLPRAFNGRAPLGFVEPTEDGWVKVHQPHLIVSGDNRGPVSVVVDCRAPQLAFPVTVWFDYEGHREMLRFLGNGQQHLQLQFDSRSQPKWVQVNVEPTQSGGSRPVTPEIRIKVPDVPEQDATP